MLRKFVGVVVVMALCVGFTLAEEIRAVITKVDGDNVTFYESKGKGEKGDKEMKLSAEGAKIVKAKFDKDTKKLVAGDALEGGLKNELFTKIGEKGLFGTVVTDADGKKITEIRVFAGKGK